jgi:hypothetical protein
MVEVIGRGKAFQAQTEGGPVEGASRGIPAESLCLLSRNVREPLKNQMEAASPRPLASAVAGGAFTHLYANIHP